MKIGQYKQMNNHLTRKATPEERKKLELKNQEELKKRIAKKRSEYGLAPGPVKVNDPLSKNFINAHHTFNDGPFVVDQLLLETRLSMMDLKKKVLKKSLRKWLSP